MKVPVLIKEKFPALVRLPSLFRLPATVKELFAATEMLPLVLFSVPPAWMSSRPRAAVPPTWMVPVLVRVPATCRLLVLVIVMVPLF